MLGKSTEYAIRSLVYIQLQSWKGKRPGVIEIAREIEAPTAYTAKILHTLTKKGVLDSMKGRGGGFLFPDHESGSTLYEVIVIMEGDGLFNKCGFGLKTCSDDSPCPLHNEYKNLSEGFYELVNRETISSLALKIREGKAILSGLKS